MAELKGYFRVQIHPWEWYRDKDYFYNFYTHCLDRLNSLGLKTGSHEQILDAMINRELRPHGRLIKTKTQGWYLRWTDAKYHTAFVLRWSR